MPPTIGTTVSVRIVRVIDTDSIVVTRETPHAPDIVAIIPINDADVKFDTRGASFASRRHSWTDR